MKHIASIDWTYGPAVGMNGLMNGEELSTAEQAECNCPDACERDHDND